MSIPADDTEGLIRIIREKHGFYDHESTPSPVFHGLRGILERALERLSGDLYNKKTHFLLEFIQNADDNKYQDDVIPSLNLRIEEKLIVFECNELGFSAENVEAICDIGASTKTREKSARGFIGEKGIGFKSVFTVANEVHISSGPYSFHFDQTTELGMITPVSGSAYPKKRGWTTFHLRLAPSENGAELSAQLRGLRPTLLLFLRKLRALTVTVTGTAQDGALQMRRKDSPGDDLVSLERIDDGKHSVDRYVLVRHLAKTPALEPGREGVEQSEIMLAFPVTETGEPVIEMQEVHAFLPLRCHGFNFIVQADFITSASREDVLPQKKWNCSLRDSVVDAFLLAVERFADHSTLRNVWFRYLPISIPDSFFAYVEHKLMLELQPRPILRCSNGTHVRGSQLIILIPPYRDDLNEPLIPEAHLPHDMHYLSSDYDAHRDGHLLRSLGVREMTDDDFLEGMTNMDLANLFGAQSATWHDSVATCLLRLTLPSLGGVNRAEVPNLRILPLHDGNWAAASLASTCMFPPAGVSIPDDLDLQSIAPGVSTSFPRYQLFVRLGVTQPNPATIANRILSKRGPRSVRNGVAHARFFFEHRTAPSMPSVAGLRFVDEQDVSALANELYLDLPGEDGALALRDALSPHLARFLHFDYLSAYPEDEEGTDTWSKWVGWLQEVGVNVVPRVLNGNLTSEFLDHAPELRGQELLTSLRAWWPRLSNRLTEAGKRELGTVSIAGRPLDRLYLRRGALALADQGLGLPFVPVEDPEDRGWDFLELLGVATRLNAQFFVNKLLHMQAQGEKDGEAVVEIYKQLDARFDEDEALIRNAFEMDPIILVFVNNQSGRLWLRKADVRWYGPPSLTTKAIISRSYPELLNFFFMKLGIPNASSSELVDELRAIERTHQGESIPQGVQEHVADILTDISDIVEGMETVPEAFEDLAHMAIFPASVPPEGIGLRTVDTLYVPDKSGKYADVFRDRVALLALPETVTVNRIRPLLESPIFVDRMRFLRERVTKGSTPQGERIPDTNATGLFSSRADYIARLVYHRNRASPAQQARILAKLRNISVISVESITTTLSLGTCTETTPENVSSEETEDRFTVFVSRTGGISGRSINTLICKELSRLLDVKNMELFTCISNAVEVVRDLFSFDGIEEIPEDDPEDDQDRTWLQAILHPNEPVVPIPIAVVAPEEERPPSPAAPPSPLLPPPSVPALTVEDTQPFPPLGTLGPRTPRQRSETQSTSYSASPAIGPGPSSRRRRNRSAQSSVGVSEHSQFLGRSRSPFNASAFPGPAQGFLQPAAPLTPQMGNARDRGRPGAPPQALLNGGQMMPGPLGNPVLPPFVNFNVPLTGNDDTDMVGILGEHYVYKMLCRKLDDFRPENWTSELRHFIPGLAPFRGTAYADFTYDDTRGQLTREWYGPEKAALWQGRWPRYHIEVKSTRGEDHEPFHMSRAQMITASRYSERTEVGTDVYVVMRVSRIGNPEPLCIPYVDPDRMMYYGRLLYLTDVYLHSNQFQDGV